MRTAALIFDKPRDEVTADERRAAKTINFGVIYGMGDSALAKQLGIPREQAARFIAAYFARYAGRRALHGEDGRGGAAGRGRAHAARAAALPAEPALGQPRRFASRPSASRATRRSRGRRPTSSSWRWCDLGRGRARAPARAWCSRCTTSWSSRCRRPTRSARASSIRERMAGAMKLAVPLRRRRGLGQELGRGALIQGKAAEDAEDAEVGGRDTSRRPRSSYWRDAARVGKRRAARGGRESDASSPRRVGRSVSGPHTSGASASSAAFVRARVS